MRKLVGWMTLVSGTLSWQLGATPSYTVCSAAGGRNGGGVLVKRSLVTLSFAKSLLAAVCKVV